MKISKFRIRGFKGIVSTDINISDEVPGRIIPLIGLNESGKTTILEAISSFYSGDTETKNLVEESHKFLNVHDMIPKHKKGAFTGKIGIEAIIKFDDEDKKAIADHFDKNHSIVINTKKIPDETSVDTVFNFEDSTYKSISYVWSIKFYGKNKGKHKEIEYNHSDTKNLWLSGIGNIRDRIPKVSYFPTFLFDFPDRIYLEDVKEDNKSKYYSQLIQDVMDGMREPLSIQKHIVDRVKRHRKQNLDTADFVAKFYSKDERKQIDAVIQQLSHEMTRRIFGAWGEIIGKELSDKRIQVDWSIDTEKGNIPFIEIEIVDGASSYGLAERSLGFRWFFAFLLFTQFRKNRSDGQSVIFLFDEPASNLHSRAQAKLLESFLNITGDRNYIVYSTHSHFMINPLWLEKAYIVQNQNVDYDMDSVSDAVERTPF